jgi:hypothetical protein
MRSGTDFTNNYGGVGEAIIASWRALDYNIVREVLIMKLQVNNQSSTLVVAWKFYGNVSAVACGNHTTHGHCGLFRSVQKWHVSTWWPETNNIKYHDGSQCVNYPIFIQDCIIIIPFGGYPVFALFNSLPSIYCGGHMLIQSDRNFGVIQCTIFKFSAVIDL